MTFQTIKEKILHTYKELIRRITFKYVKLLPLNWPQNKVASQIAITEKKKNKSHIYMPEVFWRKFLLILQMSYQFNVMFQL